MQRQWRVFVICTVTILLASLEKATGQSTESVFIEQPESLDQCINKSGAVVILEWKIQYEQCVLFGVFVNTLNHTLYPSDYNENFISLPIERNKDYNVTEDTDNCKSEVGKTKINVTLSIHLSEHVLKHVPYVVCMVSTLGDGKPIDHRSEKVSFQVDGDINCTVSTVTSTETTENATTTYTYITNACYSMQYKTHQNSILFAILCLMLMSDYYYT